MPCGAIDEKVALLNNIGDHFANANQPKEAAIYFQKAKEAQGRAEIVKNAIKSQEEIGEFTLLQNKSEEEQ